MVSNQWIPNSKPNVQRSMKLHPQYDRMTGLGAREELALDITILASTTASFNLGTLSYWRFVAWERRLFHLFKPGNACQKIRKQQPTACVRKLAASHVWGYRGLSHKRRHGQVWYMCSQDKSQGRLWISRRKTITRTTPKVEKTLQLNCDELAAVKISEEISHSIYPLPAHLLFRAGLSCFTSTGSAWTSTA